MKFKRNSKVGRDGDGLGILVVIVFIIVIIAYILMAAALIIIGIGAAIGAWYSISNYVMAFKENVIDSNKTPVVIEE